MTSLIEREATVAAVVRVLRQAFADGTFFVALAPIADATLVQSAIAQAPGVNELDGRPMVDRLKAYLMDRQRLLVASRSDEEIGETPFINRRTAMTHVSHLLTKLGVTSRGVTSRGVTSRGVTSLLTRPEAGTQQRPKVCRPLGGACFPKRGIGCCGNAACRRGKCRCGRRQRACRGRCLSKRRCCRNQDCGRGQICRRGRCQCPAGKRRCGKRCVPRGTCCPGETKCNGTCVNMKTSANHCGRCGFACAGTATCQSGVCLAGAKYRFVRRWDGASGGSPMTPRGIAVDGEGFVYVTDNLEQLIRKFTGSGDFVVSWPSTWDQPAGIDIDASGIVYVASYEVNTAERAVQAYSGNGIPVPGRTLTPFQRPYGVAVNRNGDVYAAINEFRAIQRFRPNGDVDTWEEPDYDFNFPFWVAVAPNGDVYVSNSGTSQIKWFSADGAPKGAWGGQGVGDGLFEELVGLTVDAVGFVYAVDIGAARVQKFTASGDFVGMFGDSTLFQGPVDVAVSLSGMVYVADFTYRGILQFEPA